MEDWKYEFYEYLGAVDVENLKIEQAQMLKIGNLPKFLYKYRPPSDFAFENLESDTVWLNKPSDYNDPFEFVEFLNHERALLAVGNTIRDETINELLNAYPVPEEIINQAKDSNDPLGIIGKYQLVHSGEADEETADKILKTLNDIVGKKVIERNAQKIKVLQDKMKVCSFCESPSQLLMWGHYTDNHKGFCVEYNIEKWHLGDIRNRMLFPVRYQNDFYDFTEHLISQITKGVSNNLYPLISGTTKSLDWEYEKEWRFIFNIGDSFPTQNYRMDCQTKVYIGSRMSEEHKNRIIDICKTKKLKLYLATPCVEKYEMIFEEISI